MATTKKEMTEMIRQMAEMDASVEWFRARNEELRKKLQNISVNGPNYDGNGLSGNSGPGDPVGQSVMEREAWTDEMEINSRIIKGRLAQYARLSAMMGEELMEDERKVIWAKYGEQLSWGKVARTARMSRSTCIRIADSGLGKLCVAWDRDE